VKPFAWTNPGLTVGIGGERPSFNFSFRPHVIHDDSENRVLVLSPGKIFVLDVNAKQWVAPVMPAGGPGSPELCGYAHDPSTDLHYFVGPPNSLGGTVRVWTLSYTGGVATWTQLSTSGSGNPPSNLGDSSCLIDSGFLYVINGRNVVTNQPQRSYHRLSLTTLTWGLMPIAPGFAYEPPERADAALVAATFGAFYIGGKTNLGPCGDFWGFIPGGPPTFEVPEIEGLRPQGRYSAAACYDDNAGEGYMYGGRCAFGNSGELWRFQWNSSSFELKWDRVEFDTSLTPPPPALRGSTLVYDRLRDRLLLFGGAQGTTTLGTLHATVWAFDLSSESWTALAPTGTGPSPRYLHTACWIDDTRRMYVFGGDNGTRLGDAFELDLTGSFDGAWLQPAITGTPPDARSGAVSGYNNLEKFLKVGGGNSNLTGNNKEVHLLFRLATPFSWSQAVMSNPASADNFNEVAGQYDEVRSRLIVAPQTRGAVQIFVPVTTSTGGKNPTWQFSTNSGANNLQRTVGAWAPDSRAFFVLMGEQFIAGPGNVPTNTVKVIRFQP
jgi:hypothetical protein